MSPKILMSCDIKGFYNTTKLIKNVRKQHYVHNITNLKHIIKKVYENETRRLL